jgi:hypothetical protein
MEERADELLSKLRVISILQPQDRLSVRRDGLHIYSHLDSASLLQKCKQPMLRWWNQDSRTHTLDAISALVKESSGLCVELKKSKNDVQIDRFINQFTEILKGLDNLKTTYKSDAHTVSIIETIKERVLLTTNGLQY